jgi:DNA repair exonuclease SbcCD ATPase subunit
MHERMFDESYNIREVLDDVIERVALREKLVQTAKQFSEKKREERFTLAIKQFENLMGDFLRLYQPILDRIRSHREALQKELSGLRSALATVNGMLEVSKGIEGLATRVQRLEADAEELDTTIKEKTKTAEKIDDLLNRVRPYLSGVPGSTGRDSLSDVLGGMPKDLFPDMPETGKEAGVTRKAAARS